MPTWGKRVFARIKRQNHQYSLGKTSKSIKNPEKSTSNHAKNQPQIAPKQGLEFSTFFGQI